MFCVNDPGQEEGWQQEAVVAAVVAGDERWAGCHFTCTLGDVVRVTLRSDACPVLYWHSSC